MHKVSAPRFAQWQNAKTKGIKWFLASLNQTSIKSPS